MTTYEAITLALQSNMVLVGLLTIVVMFFVENKKK